MPTRQGLPLPHLLAESGSNTYAIVENPGTDREDIVETGLKGLSAANHYLMTWYRDDERGVFAQIMKETPEGLTTEF